MSVELRLPSITATTPNEQIVQMQSYLHQMVQQLNWALSAIGSQTAGEQQTKLVVSGSGTISQEAAQETFNAIKALIITSAEIVRAYEEKWNRDFNGTYFADSDFGTFIANTNLRIEANSTSINEKYSIIQSITNTDGTGTLDILSDNVRKTNAYINRGILYIDDDGNTVTGIEIGETTNGKFHKYARFVADQLTFYDSNDNEVAHIGSRVKDERTDCLYITGAASFLGDIQFGGYKSDTHDGIAFTWIGGG